MKGMKNRCGALLETMDGFLTYEVNIQVDA